jgi:tetratricopeptide (TPR) repeat protein
MQYSSRGDLDLALADYTAAIGLNPNDSHFYTGRGYVFRRKGALDRALADFTRAIEVDPADAGAYSNRASIYESYRKFDLAIADYSKAIEIIPTDAEAFVFRAGAYRAKAISKARSPTTTRPSRSTRRIQTPTAGAVRCIRRRATRRGRRRITTRPTRSDWGRCWRRRRSKSRATFNLRCRAIPPRPAPAFPDFPAR